jgi:regulator of protease activity HflC (stomatin/prohibitin superfamily)
MAELGQWIMKLFEAGWDYIKIFTIIAAYEEGVLLRIGKPLRKGRSILKPGFHLKFPILDYVYTAIVTTDTMEIKAVNITTLDGKTSTNGLIIKIYINI